MKEDKIIASPESYHTSALTPIIVQNSSNIKITFDGLQVDNNNDLKRNIKGKFVIKKKSKKNDSFDDEKKFTRKDISNYNCIEIALDTDSTYKLGKGLCDYYRLFSGKRTNPYEDVTFVQTDSNMEYVKSFLQSSESINKIIREIDTNTLNMALNIKNLESVKDIIEKNLTNNDESFWQDFFTTNTWALSQLFNSPYMVFNGNRYVGGKILSNKGGKFTDFIYKNNITKNIAIIEIKTPATEIFKKNEYRQDIPEMSKEIIGGVTQILNQKQTLNNEYFSLKGNSIERDEDDFNAYNIQGILLVGNCVNFSKNENKIFEIYRNELKSISIITFDELLTKIDTLLKLLK